jgi:hypothetical protein
MSKGDKLFMDNTNEFADRQIKEIIKDLAIKKDVKLDTEDNKPIFTWIPFYQELASKLLEYKESREHLIDFITEIKKEKYEYVQYLDKDYMPEKDIDPFTFFGILNRGGENRRKQLAEFMKQKLSIEASLPNDFEGIPVLNNLNSIYSVNDNEIDLLWNLFEKIVKKEDLEPEFSQCLSIKNCALAKITSGCYWANPIDYIPLDDNTRKYLKTYNITCKSILTGNEYNELIQNVREQMENDTILEKSFPELSRAAWKHSAINPEVIDDLENETKHSVCNIQEIFYGVPGSGKSNKIKMILESQEEKGEIANREEQITRIVFHPEYTNSDFIGQVMPKRIEGKGLDYSFTPGPFAKVLRKAYLNPDKPYYLIVEEINRGNAAAIFGDIFQLLDRLEAEDNPEIINNNTYTQGWSSYSIENDYLNWYIRDNSTTYEDGSRNPFVINLKGDDDSTFSEIAVGGLIITANTSLRLPPNLSILGTMNTSDQNVFTLDNAFQRRWDLVLIENEFPDEKDKDFSEKIKKQRDAIIEDTQIKWDIFRTEINKIIAQESVNTGLSSMEDKRLGCWFVKNKNGIISKEVFVNKVLKYLWDDAFKFSRSNIFNNYNTFEDLRKNYLTGQKLGVFKVKLEGVNNTLNQEEIIENDNDTEEN